jgi:hypothetical protein
MVTFTITATARRYFKVVDLIDGSPKLPEGDPDNPLEDGETWAVTVSPQTGTGNVDIYWGDREDNMRVELKNQYPKEGQDYEVP